VGAMATTASTELFSIGAATPTGGRAFGGAAASVTASAEATTTRGFRLVLGAEAAARADASIRDLVAASLSGGVGVKARIDLAAAFPLDLFNEAGIVARIDAAAEAAAYLRASLGLDLQVFERRVRERFEGPLAELCGIFLEETAVEAGLWARVAFAAQLHGEATVTGSLLSSATGGPGFSVSLAYGAGVGLAAGADFLVNIGLVDPPRLLNRLSDRLTAEVVGRAAAHAATLTGPSRAAADEALAYLRILLPLAGRTAFELGALLVQSEPPNQRREAALAIGSSFVSEAQELLLQHLCDFALGRARAEFDANDFQAVFDALDADGQGEVLADLGVLRDALLALGQAAPASGSGWLDALLACLAAAEALLQHGLIGGAPADDFEEALAHLWAAGTLLSRVVTWLEASGPAPLFGTDIAPIASNSTVAAHVAAAIHKPAGTGVTLADLASFLVGANLLVDLKAAPPPIGPVVTWLDETFSSGPGHDLVQQLLIELVPLDDERAETLLASLGQTAAEAIRDRIVPDLVEPLKQADPGNRTLAEILDDIAVPTLVALPALVLEQVPTLGTEEGARRLREALSAVLLQPLGKFLLASTDVLLEHALTEGAGSLRAAGAAIAAAGDAAPGFAAIATVATGALLPIAVTPKDVEELLGLAADVAERWNDKLREPVLHAMGELLLLGLSVPQTRDQTFATLLRSDAAPQDARLHAVLDQVERGVWDTVLLLFPRLLALAVDHFVHEAEAIAVAIYEGAKAVVAAVDAAIAWLGQQVDELRYQLAQLMEAAKQLVADLSAKVLQLSRHLLTLEDAVVASVRAAGWSVASEVISWAPGFVRDAIRDVYNTAFDALRWALEAPLALLSSIAAWVHEVVIQHAGSGIFSRSAVDQEIRDRIHASGALDLTIDLTVDLGWAGTWKFGKITIPAGDVIGAIASVVLGDEAYGNAVDALVTGSSGLHANQAQQQATQSAIAGALDQQQGQATVAALTTGKQIAMQLSVANGSIHQGRAIIHIHVFGVNETFVDTPLNVPRRIRVHVNGTEYQYAADQWQRDPPAIVLSLCIVPGALGLLPTPVEPTFTFTRTRLPPGATLQATAGAAGNELTLSVADAAAPQPLAVPGPTPPTPGPPTDPTGPSAARHLLDDLEHAAAVDSATALGRATPPTAVLAAGDLVPLPTGAAGATTVTSSHDAVVLAAPTGAPAVAQDEAAQGWHWTILPGSGAPERAYPIVVGRPGVNVVQVAASDGKSASSHAATTFLLEA
jgi:hypothetical protein